ncbi:MAG: energy-coupling factor transporter transmembrane protein EcfT, partial [Mycobacteriales bacterium]
AAAMDSRGYGGRRAPSHTRRRLLTATTTVGLLAVCAGSYGVLDAGTPHALGLPLLVVGLALSVGSVLAGSAHTPRTRYRPDLWRRPEWTVAACGAVALLACYAGGHLDPTGLHPSVSPLALPGLPWVATAGVLAALLPAVVA